MIKQILSLAVASLVSLNASAGYVEYTFAGPLSGVFAQNTGNKSIADYFFTVNGSTYGALFQVNVSNGSQITGVSTRFSGAGPTNFSIIDRNSQSSIYELGFTFWESDIAGRYNYLASYSQRPDTFYPQVPGTVPTPRLSQTFFGFAYERPSTITPEIHTSQDGTPVYSNGLPVLIPRLNQVPEPTSFALLGIGAFALMRRRIRK